MFDLSEFETNVSVWWDNVKAFFERSEVVLYSRLQVLSGFALAVFGGIDWTSVTTQFGNAKTALYTGLGLIVNGVLTELLRRRNAVLPVPPKA